MLAAPSLTSVHPQEIKPPIAQEPTPWGTLATSSDPEVLFRHSGWARRRVALREALAALGARPRQLLRWDLCGCSPWVVQDPDDPERYSIHVNTCKSRWCMPCASTRAHVIATNLRKKLGDTPHRMITLTLRASIDPLRVQLDRLYACFRALRKTAFWRTHVHGGACVLECKHSSCSPLWHPHLHVLASGIYIPKGQLRDHWQRITGDSFIVDVLLIRDKREAAKYVAKYVAKPIVKSISLNTMALHELLVAFAGRRTVLTFGTWRRFRLTQPLDSTAWKQLAPLEHIILSASRGNPRDQWIISALGRSHPKLVALFIRSPPTPDTC